VRELIKDAMKTEVAIPKGKRRRSVIKNASIDVEDDEKSELEGDFDPDSDTPAIDCDWAPPIRPKAKHNKRIPRKKMKIPKETKNDDLTIRCTECKTVFSKL